MSARRIGLYGGAFDPPHNAHRALARLAVARLALDELRWMPTGDAWHKPRRLSPAQHREAMVALAIAGEPRFAIDRREIERPGATYTLDTVREMQAEEPAAEWLLVVGHDQYASLHTWYGWRELLARVTLAVAGRPGDRAVDPAVAAIGCVRLDLPPMDISSSDIRARIAAGQPVDGLVAPAVARYIDQHRLYRGRTGS